MPALRLPGPYRGLRIGLFGGSFNPAHEGHAHVAQAALERLCLDAVWWLPALGNPLKAQGDDFPARLASARRMAGDHPRWRVSDIERQLGTRYTRDTLRALLPRLAGAWPVWIMGADNLAGFHRWGGWREIAGRLPVAVIARPGAGLKARHSRFARTFAASRIDERDARALPFLPPPAWVWLNTPFHPASSTAIRHEARARNPFRHA